MSPDEARSLLNLNLSDSIEEQIELLLFKSKQKIYRQIDQVLLYAKWTDELMRLESAANTLGVVFENEDQATLNNAMLETQLGFSTTLILQFNVQQQIKNKIAFLIYNAKSPKFLTQVLCASLNHQKKCIKFWASLDLQPKEVLLSRQFDPQQILAQLKHLNAHKIVLSEELTNENTPLLLQEFVAWNKAIWKKLNGA